MHPSTKAIHASYHADGPNQPVSPPLHTSTIWTHGETGLNRGPDSYAYTRFRNPNRQEFEQVVTALEGGATTIAFSSGMAAITAVFQALKPGDHVIVCDDVYFGTRLLLDGLMKRWGIQTDYVDARVPANIEAALRPETRLVWLESPSNPMLYITDIREVCDRVRSKSASSPATTESGENPGSVAAKINDLESSSDNKGMSGGSASDGVSNVKSGENTSKITNEYIYICVDNTWATPLLQQPLALGADIVMHSCSKYFSGHSDILAGSITCKSDDDFAAKVLDNQRTGGAVLAPFDAWMLTRSTKTLHARMRIHCENAKIMAEYLQEHPKVEQVFYPGLADVQGHEIAKKQMSDFGGMVSTLIKADKTSIVKEITMAKVFKVATSLGGVESTWENRKSSEGEGSNTPDNLVRFSVGIEDPRDLISDVEQVLKRF